ncbi:hypothetical protein R3W88_017039 [Solanum pinnatisectum]|uniref:Uncharacterized protein n=1 Tax=Solanum pinnatisectum TaxID=50273 RepID=A0AAV9KZF6_9SOLN|nr:hypothetical protein R3W88_017039 [Solanum pinnatisectum]
MANNQLPISIGSEKEGNFTYAMQLLSSSVLPFVLNSTIELDVFEILAKANDTQLSSSQIVSKMACNNPIDAANMLDRMLYVLATYSLLTCSINNNKVRLYGLSPVGKMFVSDNEDGASLGPVLALLQHKVFINTWFGLSDTVLEGGFSFERMHSVNLFEYQKTDPKLSDVFNKAMISHTTLVMKNILDTYKGFEDIKDLVDVGGGVEHVGGDMFASVPGGDAIFMKWILHDWTDSHCVKLLKNCYKSTPTKNGKVIVVEAILPVKPDPRHTSVVISQTDMIMLAQTPGGKERSQKEFQFLATEAGFSGINFICCVSNFWVMEFYK